MSLPTNSQILLRFDQDIRRSVEILRRIPAVRKVWLFGSVARKRRPTRHSDLDFAVEGLPSGAEWGLWSVLDEALSSPVDLIRLEDAPPELKTEIMKGELLYEA